MIELEDLADRLESVTWHRNRTYIRARCPFHQDRDPSLLVFRDGWFRCLGGDCGRHGDFNALDRKLRGWERADVGGGETVEWRPPRLPTDPWELEKYALDSHEALMTDPQFAWYYRMRGVADRIEPCLLGWRDGWYTIPILDRKQNVKGLVLRAGPHIEKATGARFHQPLGQKPMAYVPDWTLFDHSPKVAVVFGIFDALALATLRFGVLTTTAGDLTTNPLWFEEVRKPVVIIPDKGAFRPAKELAAGLGWRGTVLELPYPEAFKDPADYLQAGKGEDLRRLLAGGLT